MFSNIALNVGFTRNRRNLFYLTLGSCHFVLGSYWVRQILCVQSYGPRESPARHLAHTDNPEGCGLELQDSSHRWTLALISLTRGFLRRLRRHVVINKEPAGGEIKGKRCSSFSGTTQDTRLDHDLISLITLIWSLVALGRMLFALWNRRPTTRRFSRRIQRWALCGRLHTRLRVHI